METDVTVVAHTVQLIYVLQPMLCALAVISSRCSVYKRLREEVVRSNCLVTICLNEKTCKDSCADESLMGKEKILFQSIARIKSATVIFIFKSRLLNRK